MRTLAKLSISINTGRMALKRFSFSKMFYFILMDLVYWSSMFIPVIFLVRNHEQNQYLFFAFVAYLGFMYMYMAPVMQEWCLRIYLEMNPWWSTEKAFSGLGAPVSWTLPFDRNTNGSPTRTTGRRSHSIFSFVPTILLKRLHPEMADDEYVEQAGLVMKDIFSSDHWVFKINQGIVTAFVVLFLFALYTMKQNESMQIYFWITLILVIPTLLILYEVYLAYVFCLFLEGASTKNTDN